MSKKYELIIFDCDGTLVDSEPITCGLITQMIQERGIEISMEKCLHLFAGKTIGHILHFIESNDVAVNHAAFESEYRSRCDHLFKTELKAVSGVHELLNTIDIPICVASNGPRIKMKTTLPATGLDGYFHEDNIFSAYDIDAWKPKPDLFLHVANSMNVEYEKCLIIEDTWSGVMGAINAQIDVWAYNPHYDRRLFLNKVSNFNRMSLIGQNLKYYI